LVPEKPNASEPNVVEPDLDVALIYAEHAQFLWRSLYRMGIPESDLADLLQEVLLVVHRRLDSYDRSCRLTTWLFGICLRVAATARRGRRRRREEPMDPNVQEHILVESNDPEQNAMTRDARRRLDLALDSLEPEKRAVLVMFELEGMACAEIGELLGVPKGTVFSRLSSARQGFLAALRRLEKREGGKGLAMGGRS
jgi:RNA polymerase sigma-70 factor, ECF subfamily